MTAITCTSDELLTVYVNRDNPAAAVTYRYDDGEIQNTPFQTADFAGEPDQAVCQGVDLLLFCARCARG